MHEDENNIQWAKHKLVWDFVHFVTDLHWHSGQLTGILFYMRLHKGTTSLSFTDGKWAYSWILWLYLLLPAPCFWQAISGGWIIRLLQFSAVASSHWVGNEKRHFPVSIFISFIFVMIICCLSLAVSVFSPVVSFLFKNLRLLKCLFFLFLHLQWPRSSLLIYSSCCHGIER